MTEPVSIQQVLLRELRASLEPLVVGSEEPELAAALLADLGWSIDTIATGGGHDFITELAGIAAVVIQIDPYIEHPPQQLSDLVPALDAVQQVVKAIGGLSNAAGPVAGPAMGQIGEELFGHLVARHLRARQPALAGLFDLLNVITVRTPSAVTNNDQVLVRVSQPFEYVDFGAIVELVRDPGGRIRERFIGSGFNDESSRLHFVSELTTVLQSVVVPLGAEIGNDLEQTIPFPPDATAQLLAQTMTVLWRGDAADPAAMVTADAGFSLQPVHTADRGSGVLIAPFGGLQVSRELDGWMLDLGMTAELPGVLLDGAGAEFIDPTSPVTANAEISLRRIGPTLVFGSPNGTRVETRRVTLTVWAAINSAGGDFGVKLVLPDLALAVTAPGNDGFLAMVLPDGGVRGSGGVEVSWGRRDGLRVGGSAGLAFTLPLAIALGPIHLDSLGLAVKVDKSGLRIPVGINLSVSLGPFSAVVTGMGVRGELATGRPEANLGSAQLDVEFQPPSAVGLSLSATAVSGGGFLSLDEQTGRYAGVFELTVLNKIAVKAVAIIATKLPDGSPGFALLIMITAEGFTPIPLGLGFTLTGIGGLLAINHTVDADRVRDGLRNGVLDSVLFAKNPIKHANTLLSTLDQIFPAAPDRLLIGPLAEISWGSPTIVKIRLALLLEIPKPIRVVLLAALSVQLPDPTHPVVELHVDAIGELDLAKGQLSLDASLHDSRILSFTLTGDLALRLNWGHTPIVVMSVGGFHPRFRAPAGIRPLRRLALTLSNSANPRVRFEAYLALTSNTIQFGARIEVHAEALGLMLDGGGSFDALIQWSPFALDIGLSAWVRVAAGSVTLLAAAVSLNVTGPQPWHVTGEASVSVLTFKAKIGIDLTVGGTAPPPRVVDTVDLGDEIWKQLVDRKRWDAALPAGVAPGVTLAEPPPDADRIVVHPFAVVGVRQPIAPLGSLVERVGGRLLSNGPDTFTATLTLPIGVSASPLHDLFAPAQYRNLSDDERLTDTFASLESGVSMMPQAAYTAGPAMSDTVFVETFEVSGWDVDSEPLGPTSASTLTLAPAGASTPCPVSVSR